MAWGHKIWAKTLLNITGGVAGGAAYCMLLRPSSLLVSSYPMPGGRIGWIAQYSTIVDSAELP